MRIAEINRKTNETDISLKINIDGKGEKVTLTYPDGMISWLSGFKSKFNGKAAKNSGNDAVTDEGVKKGLDLMVETVRNFIEYILK